MEPDDWDGHELEGMEEEVFEEIVEDETSPFADLVLPLPGDFQAMHEMLEGLRRDVQQLQEESD
jgi:hypothetical protein